MDELDSIIPYTHSELVTRNLFEAMQSAGPKHGVEVIMVSQQGEPYGHHDLSWNTDYQGIVPPGHVYVQISTFAQNLGDFWQETEKLVREKTQENPQN